jgi:hypothetical protein
MTTSNAGFRANTQYTWLSIVALGSMLGCSPSQHGAPDTEDPSGQGDQRGSTKHADGAVAGAPGDAGADCGAGGEGSSSGGGAGGTSGGGAGGAPACMNADCNVGDSTCSDDPSQSVVDLCVLDANGCTTIVPSQCPGSAVCQRTSIAQCSGQELAEWPISNAPSEVAVGAPNLETFVDNLDGTVTDKVTGLMWEQEFHLSMFPQPEFCATSVTTGGHKDWRMPTIIELISLADFTRDNPSIDTTFFPLSPGAGPFWSSTIRVGFGSSVDIIDYSFPFIENSGGFGVEGQPGQNIRCVR